MTNIKNYKPKFLKYFFITAFSFFLLSIFVFRPYETVIFDSEPDYLANALHIIDWGIPWGGHHPGTPVQYLYAIIIKNFNLHKLNLDSAIIFLRLVNIAVCTSLIFFAKRFVKKDKNIFIYTSLLFILLFPLINFHLTHFGVELILFSISVLFWVKIYYCLTHSQNFKTLIILPIIVGFALSLKFNSILLYFVYLFVLFFFLDKSFSKKIYIFIYSLISTFVIFLISSFPSIRYYPKLYNKISREIKFDLLLIDNFLNLLLFSIFFLFIFLIFFYFYNYRIVNFFNNKKKIVYCSFVIIIVVFSFFSIILNDEVDYNFRTFFFSLAELNRNLIPIFPVFIIILTHIKIKFNFNFIFLLILFNLIIFHNFFYERENFVDTYIKENNQKKIIAFTDSSFSSKNYFIHYSKKRWGNDKINVPKKWIQNVNFDIIFNDIFKLWIFEIIDESLEKNDEQNKKYNLKGKERINLGKFFKSVNYENIKKFRKISLIRPNYNSRLKKNYCDFFINDVSVIFLNNPYNKKNLLFFENSLNVIRNHCKISNIIKKNIADLIIFKFIL